ncbi:MAG TPA: hypothetical protein VD978_26185 [Azospirillum sp.]|nr:hypothetical protein [Azospirillum sp.]
MLFLRDIQVDIQMRCRRCGHAGLLARPDLERRFGPNYPVLSIAPHYRCSRCDSKDVESRPALKSRPPIPAAEEQHGFDGALGAPQGLLQSIHTESPTDDSGVQNLMDDELLDTMAEEQAVEEANFDLSIAALRSLADEDEEDEPAGLPLATVYDEPVDEEPKPEEEPDDAPAEALSNQMLAALHALFAEPTPADTGDEDREEETPDDLDDVPAEEILSFAVRDPDFRRDADTEPPDLDAEPDPEESTPEPESEPEPEPFRRRPAPSGSFDESLAALRALVEKAAAEQPEPEPRSAAPPLAAVEEPDEAAKAAIEPSAKDEPGEDKEPPAPYKTAQEKSLEETLAQLRGMLDLDNKAAGGEGEPVIKPRRR